MKICNKVICSVIAVIGIVTGGIASLDSSVGQVVIEGQTVTALRVSEQALEMIGNAEGCRRSPYTCPAGKPTNGIGNTHNVPDAPVPLEQVAKDWAVNIHHAELCVEDAEQASGKPMTQGQFDALTSFVFNTGCARFRRNPNHSMTQIYRLTFAGDYAKACAELPRWVYGGGKKLPGLIDRREKEYARCMEVD